MKYLCRVFVCLVLSAALMLPTAASGSDLPEESQVLPVGSVISDSPPSVSASAAILTDEAGNVLWSRQADERMPMASTTKIMTALTVLSSGVDLNSTVCVSARAVGVEGSSVYLYEGERLTLRQLFDAVLMESANDAAAALAIACAGSVDAFSAQMNAKAEEMGLENTHFVNPHGLDDDAHYTTARELAAIARAAMEYEVFAETAATYKKEIPLKGNEGIRLLINHNKLLKSLNGCIGIKTGFTKKSGRCLVSACERNGVRLYCVTLNAPDDWTDHSALYEWGFSRVERVTLTEVGEQYVSLPVVGGAHPDGTAPADGEVLTAAVKNRDAVSLTLPVTHGEIRKELDLPRFLYAPVAEGALIGWAIYYEGENELCRVPLYTCDAVPLYEKPSVWNRILRWIGDLFGRE